jgi:hypothetical protein
MAYTQAPEKQTYSTERIPAAQNLDLRGIASDYNVSNRASSGMINLHPVKEYNSVSQKEEIYAETRQALFLGRVAGLSTSNPVRGMYVWEKSAGTVYYFVVHDVSVYTSTTGLAGSWTVVNTLATSAATPVGFTEFIDSTNTKTLVLVDGVEGFVFTTNAAGTKITDGDFPTPHVPYPVFVDGYLFLAKANTGDIYNSNLNNPALWTAGDFISSELYPDDIKALVKINNYILAIGTQGSEYFYDAGNATGTPLARQEGASLPFGTILPYSLASNKNTVVLIANNNDGTATLKAIEDFKHKDISPPWLFPYLSEVFTNTGTSPSGLRGYFIRHKGDLCYVFKLPGVSGFGCFVYSFDTNFWTEYKGYGDDENFTVDCTSSPTTNVLTTYVAGLYSNSAIYFGTLGPSGLSSVYTTSAVYAGTDYYHISGPTATTYNIKTQLRTANLDFGTLNLKFMNRLGVGIESFAPPLVQNLSVSTCDDDTTVFTTARTLQATQSVGYPFVTQLGSFRQRRIKIDYDGARSMRYKFIELDLNKGQQ